MEIKRKAGNFLMILMANKDGLVLIFIDQNINILSLCYTELLKSTLLTISIHQISDLSHIL